MRRFNCKNFPAEMEEVLNGYWVRHEDHEQIVLDYNKRLDRNGERYSDTYQDLKDQCNEKLENQHRTIIYLTVVVFALFVTLLFKFLG